MRMRPPDLEAQNGKVRPPMASKRPIVGDPIGGEILGKQRYPDPNGNGPYHRHPPRTHSPSQLELLAPGPPPREEYLRDGAGDLESIGRRISFRSIKCKGIENRLEVRCHIPQAHPAAGRVDRLFLRHRPAFVLLVFTERGSAVSHGFRQQVYQFLDLLERFSRFFVSPGSLSM